MVRCGQGFQLRNKNEQEIDDKGKFGQERPDPTFSEIPYRRGFPGAIPLAQFPLPNRLTVI